MIVTDEQTKPLKLRPSEIRFWQEVFLARMRTGSDTWRGNCVDAADSAVIYLRQRIEEQEQQPNKGRL